MKTSILKKLSRSQQEFKSQIIEWDNEEGYEVNG